MDAAIVEGRWVLGPEPLCTGCAQGIRIPQVMRCSILPPPWRRAVTGYERLA